MEPLFALLFFCALGVLIGVLAHWADHARVWPWLAVYAALGLMGALAGGVLLPLAAFAGAGFALRVATGLVLAMLAALLARLIRRRVGG